MIVDDYQRLLDYNQLFSPWIFLLYGTQVNTKKMKEHLVIQILILTRFTLSNISIQNIENATIEKEQIIKERKHKTHSIAEL